MRPEDVVGNARVRESLAPLCMLVCGTNVDSKRNNTAALDDDSQRDGQQQVAAYTAAVTGKNHRHRPT